jgi:hypothetical protein
VGKYCGSADSLVASVKQKAKKIVPENDYWLFLKSGNACRYKINFPAEAG